VTVGIEPGGNSVSSAIHMHFVLPVQLISLHWRTM